jgi:hypothetical protein
MNNVRFVIFVIAFLSIPRTAYADDPEEVDADTGRQIKYSTRTEIDFEEVEVDGQLVKPEGALLLDRKRATFNPLIKLRKNWDAEISASVEEVN